MSTSENRPVFLTGSGSCAEIVINAPSRRNALSISMWSALPVLVRTVDADSAAKALVIHGGAGGHFAAGVDISEFDALYADEASTRETTSIMSAALDAIATCSKPVIAAIEGSCFGAGVSLAAACDLRIASSSAVFSLPPAKLGIVYPPSDLKRLVSLIGASNAKQMLFSARRFSSDEARMMGLVNETVPEGGALQAAQKLVDEIAGHSAWSVHALKKMIGDIERGTDDEALLAYMIEGAAGADFQEGYRAFLEKRKAAFPSS
ncbi:MAG TPA: enoyl-CoA hydratase/isomerase family protein [Henriciella marina]|uniref:enoyl-CoA hydratase/isomerase family protein n=1 Tax=Henriciella sp. TaxID=1968823 RepID=UPI0017A921AD|nr:enoyl-CoA hydratase-related protein [Henriciella sp.]HIG22881.1 enoyl-CoA hydratase/isomerase family protein [Henriciella sp.]HIK65525.1 enoyl-CoA hydratase/isomerase family protein [Henriciella marina]